MDSTGGQERQEAQAQGEEQVTDMTNGHFCYCTVCKICYPLIIQ